MTSLHNTLSPLWPYCSFLLLTTHFLRFSTTSVIQLHNGYYDTYQTACHMSSGYTFIVTFLVSFFCALSTYVVTSRQRERERERETERETERQRERERERDWVEHEKSLSSGTGHTHLYFH